MKFMLSFYIKLDLAFYARTVLLTNLEWTKLQASVFCMCAGTLGLNIITATCAIQYNGCAEN